MTSLSPEGYTTASVQRPYRLDGPGQRPFTPSTPVRIRLGTPNEIKDLEQYPSPFFVYESGLPIICPTELEKFNKFFSSEVKRGSWGEGTDLRVRVNLPFFFLETAANIQIMRGHPPQARGYALSVSSCGQARAGNGLRRQGIFVSSGIRFIWRRHDPASLKQRLTTQEKMSAEQAWC